MLNRRYVITERGLKSWTGADDEFFEAALDRAGVDPDALPDVAVKFRTLARNYYIAAIIFVAAAVIMAVIFSMPLYIMIGAGFGPLIAFQGWWSAFRHWQVCHRRLGGVRDFFGSPGWWIPRPTHTARVYVDFFGGNE